MKMQAMFLATACFVSSVAAQAAAPAGAPAAATATPTAPVPLEVIVYDKNDFKGASLRISRAVADLGKLKFDNKVASLKILGSGDWVLCENRNYQGRCARVQLQAASLKLFQLNDRVSSLYPVPAPAAAPATTPAPASTPKPVRTN